MTTDKERMMARHAGLPFEVLSSGTDYIISSVPDNLPVASMTGLSTAKANADHIVMCVNVHDELVSTLEWARNDLELSGKTNTDVPIAALIKGIDAALAAAKEEE